MLKKNLERLGSSISFQLIYLTSSNNEIDRTITDECVLKILDATASAKKKANRIYCGDAERNTRKNTTPKESRRFYKNLFAEIKNEFSGSINEALKRFNESLPASVKEANRVNA